MATRTLKKPSGRKRQAPQLIPARLRRCLEEKILALGGKSVIWQGRDPHVQIVVARGEPFTQRVQMRKGEPHRCHANAAELWASAPDKYQLVTGYALSNDRWVSHSWVVDGRKLYETTLRYDRYFGAVLPPFLAFKFWDENFYGERYPEGDAPPEFWECHPGIATLVQAIGAMPREQFFRQMIAYEQGRAA